MSAAELCELLLMLIAAAASLAHAAYLRRACHGEHLPRRASWLGVGLAALLLNQAAQRLWPNPISPALAVGLIGLLPLTLTLAVEAVLRRHAPWALKLWVTVGGAAALAMGPTGLLARTPNGLTALAGSLALSYATLCLLLLRRDHPTLRSLDNQRAKALLAALGLAPLLLATELGQSANLTPVGLGPFAALLLIFALLYSPHGRTGRWRWPRNGLLLAVKTLLIGPGLWLLSGDPALLAPFTALAAGLVLLHAVLSGLHHASQAEEQRRFAAWLENLRSRSLTELLCSLRGLPLLERAQLLLPSQLRRYDLAAVGRFLRGRRRPLRLTELQGLIGRTTDGKERRAAEQLIHLLLSQRRDTVCLLRSQPLTLLLLNLPTSDRGTRPEIELTTVQRLAECLEPSPAAPPASKAAKQPARKAAKPPLDLIS